MRFSYEGIYKEFRRQLAGYVGNLDHRLEILEKTVVKKLKAGEDIQKAITSTMKEHKIIDGLEKDTKT